MDQADQLRQLVRDAAVAEPALRPGPPVVAICNATPTTGATTVACAVGRELALLGQRVLLVDADMGEANLGNVLGVPRSRSIGAVLAGRKRLREAIVCGGNGLQVLPGRQAADATPELDRAALDRLAGEFAAEAGQSDFILLDAGMAPTPWTDSLWRMADNIWLVATPSPQAIRESYAAVKLAHAATVSPGATDSNIRLLVNRTTHAAAGESLVAQFAETCERFLGLTIGRGCTLPSFATHSARGSASFKTAARGLAAELLTDFQGAFHVAAHRVPRPASVSDLSDNPEKEQNMQKRFIPEALP